MEHNDCIFCKIITKEVPAQFVKEKGNLIVIKDRSPQAPIHYLIIPKKHIQDIQALSSMDTIYTSAMIATAQELSKELPGSGDFRLVVNSGKDAGQRVFHLHMHFLAGSQFTDY